MNVRVCVWASLLHHSPSISGRQRIISVHNRNLPGAASHPFDSSQIFCTFFAWTLIEEYFFYSSFFVYPYSLNKFDVQQEWHGLRCFEMWPVIYSTPIQEELCIVIQKREVEHSLDSTPSVFHALTHTFPLGGHWFGPFPYCQNSQQENVEFRLD